MKTRRLQEKKVEKEKKKEEVYERKKGRSNLPTAKRRSDGMFNRQVELLLRLFTHMFNLVFTAGLYTSSVGLCICPLRPRVISTI